MDLISSAMSAGRSCFPNEILELIMVSIDDVPTLHQLVALCHQARLIFEARFQTILPQVIENSSESIEIREIIYATLFHLQYFEYLATGPPEIYDYSLDSCLQEMRQRPGIDWTSRILERQPMEILRDATIFLQQIAEAEVTFIQTRLPKAANRIQQAVERRRLEKPIGCPLSGSLEPTPTSTERYRIRRGLYRLWLYYVLFGDIQHPPCSGLQENEECKITGLDWFSGGCSRNRKRQAFFDTMRIWELEEFYCVYKHIRTSKLWSRSCMNCSEVFLPDGLMEHTYHCGRSTEEALKARRACCSSSSAGQDVYSHRAQAQRNEDWIDYGGVRINDPSEAAHPNAGFVFVAQHARRLHLHNTFGTGPELPGFWNWGYCMWDRDRLEAWHLVDNAAKGIVAVPEWWRESCEFELGDIWL